MSLRCTRQKGPRMGWFARGQPGGHCLGVLYANQALLPGVLVLHHRFDLVVGAVSDLGLSAPDPIDLLFQPWLICAVPGWLTYSSSECVGQCVGGLVILVIDCVEMEQLCPQGHLVRVGLCGPDEEVLHARDQFGLQSHCPAGMDLLTRFPLDVVRQDQSERMYAAVEVGMEIPSELYHAVAEVLAFLMRQKLLRT